MKKLFLSICVSLCVSASCSAANWVWWEAEDAAATNAGRGTSEDGTGDTVLSAGKWIYVIKGLETFFEYEVEVPADSKYSFYARKFWKHGPFRWRFDDQPWQEVGKNIALLDNESFKMHHTVCWVLAGEATLTKGKHRLRIEMIEAGGAFDCFLLTDGVFAPRGRVKPSEPWATPPEDKFVFTNFDTVLDSSPIDLRFLNEKVAGDGGFIEVKNGEFMQAGKPIRFVGVNAGPDITYMSDTQLAQMAKFLARKGVNLMRLHGSVFHRDGGKPNIEQMANIRRTVAAMKQEGIYTHISIYFQHWIDLSGNPAFPGYKKGQLPFAIHFYNQAWQEMYHEWWNILLTEKNPATGLALKDDPAVFGLEIINEDSFFFWTFAYQRIPIEQMEPLEKLFAAWLVKKYGTLEAAFAAWPRKHDRDNVVEARAGFDHLWALSTIRDQRAKDTARFLGEVQRTFFDSQYEFLRKKIGFRAAICGSNWRTASTSYLGALDKWTQNAADFFDHHGYSGAWSQKNMPNFHMSVGDEYADRSYIRWDSDKPGETPALDIPFVPSTIDGKPNMVSEFAYVGFNKYRAESVLLTTAIFGQAGTQAPAWFALVATPTWTSSFDGMYPIQTASDLAQFPAAALALRCGAFQPPKTVATVTVNTEEMLDLAGNSFTDPSTADTNRSSEGAPVSIGAVPLPYFAAGRVETKFSNTAPSSLEQIPIEQIQTAPGVLEGANKEVLWHYGDGLLLLKTQKSQAAGGFLSKNGKIALPDFALESPLDFGIVWASALDSKPLAESSKILLQVMTAQSNHGFAVTDDGNSKHTITALGAAPILLDKIAGTVAFARKDAAKLKVTALDTNGVPVKPHGTAENISLLPDVIYYLIEK